MLTLFPKKNSQLQFISKRNFLPKNFIEESPKLIFMIFFDEIQTESEIFPNT